MTEQTHYLVKIEAAKDGVTMQTWLEKVVEVELQRRQEAAVLRTKDES